MLLCKTKIRTTLTRNGPQSNSGKSRAIQFMSPHYHFHSVRSLPPKKRDTRFGFLQPRITTVLHSNPTFDTKSHITKSHLGFSSPSPLQNEKKSQLSQLLSKSKRLCKTDFSLAHCNNISTEWHEWAQKYSSKSQNPWKIQKQYLPIKNALMPLGEQLLDRLKRTERKKMGLEVIESFDKIDLVFEQLCLRNSWKWLKSMLVVSQLEIELIVNEGFRRPFPPFQIEADEFPVLQRSVGRIQKVIKTIPHLNVVQGQSPLPLEEAEIASPIEIDEDSLTKEETKTIFSHLAKSTLAQIYDLQREHQTADEIFEQASEVCKYYLEMEDEEVRQQLAAENKELQEGIELENRIKSTLGPQAISEAISKKNLLPEKKILYKAGKAGRTLLKDRKEKLKEAAYKEQLERLTFLRKKYGGDPDTRAEMEHNSQNLFPSEHPNDQKRVYTRVDESLLYARWGFHKILTGNFEEASTHLDYAQQNTPLDNPLLRRRISSKISKASQAQQSQIEYEADEAMPEDDEYDPLQHIWKD